MPTAPRPSKKMRKILENLLGTPPAFLKVKKSEKEQRRDRELNYQEGRRSR